MVKGLFYSAGRAIVSRDGQTTQICCPTAQNTQKPTPTKEAGAFGRLHKGGRAPSAPAPFVDSFVGVGFRVFVLLGHIICAVGAFPDTISLPAE